MDGMIGDGVVPLDFTLLQGSKQLVLRGFITAYKHQMTIGTAAMMLLTRGCPPC